MWGPKLLNKDLKSKKNDLEKELVRANEVLETLDNEFSFEKFERLFLGKLTEAEKRQLEKEKNKKDAAGAGSGAGGAGLSYDEAISSAGDCAWRPYTVRRKCGWLALPG